MAGMTFLIVFPVGGNTNLDQTILGQELTGKSFGCLVTVNQFADRVHFEIGILRLSIYRTHGKCIFLI